jgi:hypothetical protein
MPFRDNLQAALYNDPALYMSLIKPWGKQLIPFGTESFSKRLTNLFYPLSVKKESLASSICPAGTINYGSADGNSWKTELSFEATRENISGLALWFDAEPVPGIVYSNGPEAGNKIYGSAFFPFTRELKLESGSKVSVRLNASFIESDYVWSWETAFTGTNGKLERFNQSTLNAALITGKTLKCREIHKL